MKSQIILFNCRVLKFKEMNFYKIIVVGLVILWSAFRLEAQNIDKPRLVVGIVLENFNPDYLVKYKGQFGEGGFGRLMKDGYVYKNASYMHQYSQTGVDHASIYSGTNPSYHGIISHSWYNRIEKDALPNVYDKNERSTTKDSKSGNISPRNLLARTMCDELKLSNVCSRVFGVSMNPEASVLSSGHMADGAFWFDENNGKWASSSYYMDSLYNWIKDYNKNVSPDYYINRGWFPLSDEKANLSGAKMRHRFGMANGFYHDLAKTKKKSGNYRLLKATPYANTMITDFAKAIIINENLGKDADPDMLNISYSFMDYLGNEYGTDSGEKLDMMYRLDIELEKLFSFLDSQVGMDNVLVFVTVSQAMTARPDELHRKKLPGKYFSTFKAIALLKPYLNIKYGEGDWISGYDSQQIFLDRELIENKGLNLKEMQDKITDFLIQFSGVNKVIPSYALRANGFATGVAGAMQKSFNQKRSGDILISLEPGWIHEVKDREDYLSLYSNRKKVPVIWMGNGIKQAVANDRVNVEDIVPTITNILDIPLTDGCQGKIMNIKQ